MPNWKQLGLNKESHRPFGTNSEAGGAAMEYIIVSLFGTFLTIAALGYLSQVLQDKLSDIAQELGVAAPTIRLSPFGGRP